MKDLELTHIQSLSTGKALLLLFCISVIVASSIMCISKMQSYQQAKCIYLWYVENQHWKVCVTLQVRALASQNISIISLKHLLSM